VGKIEDEWRHSLTRREALMSLAGILAGSRLVGAQLDPRPLKDHRRVPGLDEMMTAFDFEPICFANTPLARQRRRCGSPFTPKAARGARSIAR
jgi:hypothetical protein